MRTAQLDGAHVEFHRGIRNPLGIKIGPAMTTDWLRRPARRARSGSRARPDHADRIAWAPTRSQTQAAAARRGRARRPAAPCCGSAIRCTATPRPRRRASRRAGSTRSSSELEQSFELHAQLGSRLGGVHVELTGEDVTECIGGARGLDEADLERAYKTPRRSAPQLRAGARAARCGSRATCGQAMTRETGQLPRQQRPVLGARRELVRAA